ncbi:Protein spitz, partial [Trichinella pseudospiralis]
LMMLNRRLLTFLFAICCIGNANVVGFASENSFWYDVAVSYFLIFTGAIAVGPRKPAGSTSIKTKMATLVGLLKATARCLWRPLRAPIVTEKWLLLTFSHSRRESCSTRPSPKHWVVRPPLSTYLLRENCTEDYAALYCLNDGICFRTKVTDTFIFSCECQPGWYGQRCEYQDTGDRYLPVQQRVEVAGIAGSVTVLIIIVIFVSVVLYIYYRRRRISETMQTTPVISYCHACDMPIRQLCSGIASSKPRSHVKNALRTSVDVGDSTNANQCDNREDAAAQTLV